MARIYQAGWEVGHLGQADVEQGGTLMTTKTRGYWSKYCLNIDTAGRWRFSIPIVSELYLGVGFYPPPDPSPLAPVMVRFHDSSGAVQARLQRNSAGLLEAYRGDGTTLLARGTRALAGERWYYVEVRLLVADSGGRFVVRVDEVTDIDFTGDTKQSTLADVAAIALNGWGTGLRYDDLVVNDTTGAENNSWPGDTAIQGLEVNAAGDVTQLQTVGSPANWENVDEVPPNDGTDYNFDSAVDDRDLYGLADLSTELSQVHAVAVWVRAQKSDAGTAGMAILIKSGGIENQGSDQALSTSWTYHNRIMDVDPTDSATWTSTKVNALQAGIKVR